MKAKKILNAKLAIILSCVAIVLSSLAIAHTTWSTMGLAKDDAFTFKLRQYQYLKLKFCYEHDIKPCNNQVIDTWNKANPSDTFNLNITEY